MKDPVKETVLLTYKEVLESIHDQENHLLLGNGFNRGLGVNTSYPNIFQKMLEKGHGLYRDVENLVKECDYDLESFIGNLVDDIDSKNTFLKKFVSNKIKLDFMQATHEIVKSAIKNVYAEENEGIFVLLKNFNNYFSLNYDPFLYLLLLNFKSSKSEEGASIVFQPSLKFIEEDMNERESNIYTEIKHARKSGTLVISGLDGDNSTTSSFSLLTKGHFTTEITEYSKRNNKGWKSKDIKRIVDILLEEEKKNNVLQKVDDGRSRQLSLFGNDAEFVFDTTSTTQNLFFLHGAFHIYNDGSLVKKITQQTNKALYERLEDILNSEERKIVCVFQSDNKKNAIDESDYLKNCFNKLKNISGKMVIIGCSMADNDDHVFEQINRSDIDTLFISTFASKKEEMYKTAMNKFPSKSVFLFDAESISYELPDKISE